MLKWLRKAYFIRIIGDGPIIGTYYRVRLGSKMGNACSLWLRCSKPLFCHKGLIQQSDRVNFLLIFSKVKRDVGAYAHDPSLPVYGAIV